MNSFKLPAIRVLELSSVVDSMQAKDMASIKDIRLNVAIVNDLNSFNKELADAYSSLETAQKEALKPYQERFKKESVDLSEEDKEKLTTSLNDEFKKENDATFTEMAKKIEELGKVELEVTLSDEKMNLLKDWITTHGPSKYLDKKVLVSVCDALNIE